MPGACVAIIAMPEVVLPSAAPMGKTGVATYTNDFVRAMVSYRRQVSGIHFFTPWSTVPLARAALHTMNPDDTSVLVKPLESFPSMLQRTPYIAVHVPGGPRIGVFANLVHRYARESTPVTATLHAASYPLISEFLQDALLSDVRAFDAVISPSSAAEAAYIHLRQALGAWVMSRKGVSLDAPWQTAAIPHGVDCNTFHPGDRRNARELLALPLDDCIALFPGRLDVATKADLSPIIALFAHRHLEHTRLVIVGQDESQAQSDVRYIEQIHNSRVPISLFTNAPQALLALLCQASDVAVFPYDNLQESFGIAVLEAMASGLPCIVPDWDGL